MSRIGRGTSPFCFATIAIHAATFSLLTGKSKIAPVRID